MTTETTASRRRRHARMIATATELVAACSEAAAAVYRPIADAPPTTEGVAVDLLPFATLYPAAVALLERARQEDTERWPLDVAQENGEAARAHNRRRVIAEAESVLAAAESGDDGTGGLPLLSEFAATGVGCGETFLTEFTTDPASAYRLLHDMTRDGEFTPAEVLDDATDTALLAALLMLKHAADEREDPSRAAEFALCAARDLTTAIRVASVDPGGDTDDA